MPISYANTMPGCTDLINKDMMFLIIYPSVYDFIFRSINRNGLSVHKK
jgi:hypothetical protein